MIKSYVISLTTAHNRRIHIQNEFDKQAISFEFFDAITPDLIEATCQKLGINLLNNQRLSKGEKACFLSHVCLWQKMLDENMDCLAIFEDDVFLGEHAHLFLDDNKWLENISYDIIKLETWQELVHLGKTSVTIHNRKLHPLKSTHVGACGYIINQSGAKQALDYIKSLPSDYIFALDHVIFGALLEKLKIHQLSPALAIQADRHNNELVSQLEHERRQNTFVYIPNDTLLRKLQKLIKRLMRSIGKRTFYQKVEFR